MTNAFHMSKEGKLSVQESKEREFGPGKTLVVNGKKYTIQHVTVANNHVQSILKGKEGFYMYIYPEGEEGSNHFVKLKESGSTFTVDEEIPIESVDME